MGLAKFFGLPWRQPSVHPGRVAKAVERAASLCRSLLSERGEVSGSLLASEALVAYESLEPPDRASFFDRLIDEFSPDPRYVSRAGDAYRQDPSQENLARLQRVVESPRLELFRRLTLAVSGTRRLVAMRGLLLGQLDRHPRWAPIAADLEHLLKAWFNRGFLALRRIDWNTSATILEKLIQYEAVHHIHGWGELRRRLEQDRRCYAFFHPAMPDEPIIFIQTALTLNMSDKVQPLLDVDSPVTAPESATCAVFYSITNCQEGLRGVPFGSFLIKRVVEELGREFPRLKLFATLSPIIGFREWMAQDPVAHEQIARSPAAARIDRMDKPNWFQDQGLCAELQPNLFRLCAFYLLRAKQRNEPLDPVARFHLRNGARLERINWLADTSATGIQRSAGLMANYVYHLPEVERNHEQYARKYKVATSSGIEAMARQWRVRAGS
jgi:malonyl-CoA decarboxylase